VRTHRGVVLAMGPPARTVRGVEVEPGFAPGDTIQFHFSHHQETATNMWTDGKPATWIPQSSVDAVWDAEGRPWWADHVDPQESCGCEAVPVCPACEEAHDPAARCTAPVKGTVVRMLTEADAMTMAIATARACMTEALEAQPTRRVTEGGPDDPFVRIEDEIVDGKLCRTITPRAYAPHIECELHLSSDDVAVREGWDGPDPEDEEAAS